MTAEIALQLGMAAGQEFLRGDHRHQVVIAKDTRLSGYLLEPALTAGFISVGMDVILVGPLPTPAVALLTRSLRADLGVMISASHNPYQDNGIKLFGPDGFKLSDNVELSIEARMADKTKPLAAPDKLGRARRMEDARGRYIEFAKNTFPRHLRLDGLKIVIDCANGAGYQVGPMVLWELGAEVIMLGTLPDGFNINKECGSTHPQAMQKAVLENKADLGIALDGDADRVVMCDEKGELLDGDQLMALVATYWHKNGLLKNNALVATDMSNLALERYLAKQGIALHRTQVGDRYVVEKMREGGFNVGGEQSGHIILTDYTTTGDGLIAALQALAVIVEDKRPVSQSGRMFTPYPQILKNIRYEKGSPDPLEKTSVKNAIEEARKMLGESGRVFIRKSGTEPLIRVMAEGSDNAQVEQAVNLVMERLKAA